MKKNMKVLLESFRGFVNEEEDEEELDLAPEAPAEELAADPEMDAMPEEADDGVSEDKVEALVDAIAAAIEQETGVSVEVEGEPAAEEPEMADAEAEMADDEEAEMVDDVDLEEASAREDAWIRSQEKAKKSDDEEAALDEIVNEVTARVTKRLVKENLKRKLARRLAK